MPRLWTETGWLRRADAMLAGSSLDSGEEKYLRETFVSSRDRLSTLATTVATVGTFVLALLAVAVGVSGSVSAEDTKKAEASAELRLLELNCAKDKDPPTTECDRAKVELAKEKKERVDERRDTVRRISTSQLATGGLMLLAFLACLASQLVNPLPPPSSGDLLTGWRAVRNRYRRKRRLIEFALVFDGLGVVSLLVGLFA